MSGKVIQVAIGAQHSIALLDNGTVIGWGNNVQKQLGDVNITPGMHTPFFDLSQFIEDSNRAYFAARPGSDSASRGGGSLLKQKYFKKIQTKIFRIKK